LPEPTLDELITKRRLRREANGAASEPHAAAVDESETTSSQNQTPTQEEEPDLETESSTADDEENEDEELPLGTWEVTPIKTNPVPQRLLPPDTPIQTPSKNPQPAAPVLSLPGIDDPLPAQESDYMTQEVPKAARTERQHSLALRNTPSKHNSSSHMAVRPMEDSPQSHRSNSITMGDSAGTSPKSTRTELSENPEVVWIDNTVHPQNSILIPGTQSHPAELLEASSAGAVGLDSSEAVANSSVSKPQSPGPEHVFDLEDKLPKRKSSGLGVDDDPEDDQRYQKRARSIQRVADGSRAARSSPIPVPKIIPTVERFHSARDTPVREQSRSLEQLSVHGSSPPKSITSDRAPEIPSKRASLRGSVAPSLSREAVMRDHTAKEIYEEFRAEHAEYTGSIDHFFNLCRWLRDPTKLRVPQMAWDDFIIRHLAEYRPYCDEYVMTGERLMDYEDYYDLATSIKYPLKVMRPDLVDAVIRELE
jgi:hypothetical protein